MNEARPLDASQSCAPGGREGCWGQLRCSLVRVFSSHRTGTFVATLYSPAPSRRCMVTL